VCLRKSEGWLVDDVHEWIVMDSCRQLTCMVSLQLASDALASHDDEAEGEDGGETTIYFDAEEGTFVNEAGEEIQVNVEDEEDEELEDDDEDEEEGEEEDEGRGGETPAPAAAGPAAGARTITSRSMTLLGRIGRELLTDWSHLQSHRNKSCSCFSMPDWVVCLLLRAE
jgi:hypothetical protein